jgi:predicted methyltransferase
MKNRLSRLSIVVLSLLALPSLVLAQSVQEKIDAAMKMSYRTEAERARDSDRKAPEALAFMGLRDNMKVIEFFPARQAWYTKVLAPVLADKGQLWVIDSDATFKAWGDLLKDPAFKTTKTITTKASYNRAERRYDIGEIVVPFKDADLLLNIREYHNMNAADKARFNKIAFNALKSGGKYVVIDHTRRHMQAEDDGPLYRREDPVDVILEVQVAGFVLEKASDMFYSAVDPLNVEVGDAAVTNRTDRFFFVFRKP